MKSNKAGLHVIVGITHLTNKIKQNDNLNIEFAIRSQNWSENSNFNKVSAIAHVLETI